MKQYDQEEQVYSKIEPVLQTNRMANLQRTSQFISTANNFF